MKLLKSKKFYLICVLVLLLLAITGVIIYLLKLNSQIKRPKQKADIVTNAPATTEIVEEQDSSFDIALFGLDARDDSYDKGNRSDVNMVAHINPETKKISIYSIYRDNYVDIPKHGMDKLTHAYSYGGYEMSINAMNTNLDLSIEKFVTVNFASVEKTIDLLGGVEVDVKQEELKWINGYMNSLYKQNQNTKVVPIYTAGLQTLTGSQAVAYCRIRYTSGGDIKRAERQRIVLNAMFEKAKKTDLSTINNIVNEMTKQIYTNLSTKEILQLAKDVAAYNIEKSEGFPYHYKATNAMCASSSKSLSVVVATNYLDDVTKLHEEVYDQKDYEPSSKVKEIANTLSPYQVTPTTEDETSAETTTVSKP